MLATDRSSGLSISGSPLRYFSDANVERYLELQKAVKSACIGFHSSASARAQERFLQRQYENHNQEVGVNLEEGGVEKCSALVVRSEPQRKATTEQIAAGNGTEGFSVKSADSGEGGERGGQFGGRRYSTPSGAGYDLSSVRESSLRGGDSRGTLRRNRSAVGESTIASRNKMRPEPKFQKVVTSQILSQMRKDSRLIAKNPSRFLDAMVDGRQQPSTQDSSYPTATFSSYLTSFTTQSASQSYQQAMQNLKEKCRQSKSRTLLLNLGATSTSSSRPHSTSLVQNKSSRASSAGFEAFLGGDGGDPGGGGDCSSPWDYSRGDADMILQSYLDDIRLANVDNLKAWVDTVASTNNMDLPFGLPTSGVLQIPTKNLEEVTTSLNSQEFVRSALEEFFLLDAEYHAKLEELSGRITDNFRELEQASWSAKDSALLFHLMGITSGSKSHHHFSSEKLCTEVATRLFQGCHSRDNIISQKYRLKVKKALEEKRDSVIKHWLLDKEKLVKKVNLAWEDIRRQELRKEEWSKEKKVQQERCQHWMDLLEKMRKDNRAKIRTISAMVEPLEEQMRRQQKAKEEVERSRRQEQKELLEKFQRIKMANREEEMRNREEIQLKLEKDRKLRTIQNRARVRLRRQEYFEKKENEKEAERRREEERKEREALLERTKEKVEIDYKPWSIFNDTHASLVRSHEIQSLIDLRDGKGGEEEETRKFFQERYGFSAETLWKDSRVRLEAKLREAGLIGNSYARHVLLAMQPKEKPHLKSQIKLSEDQDD